MLILLAANTRLVIKEMFLNIMIMFITCNIKWEKSNKLTLKIKVTIDIIDLKHFDAKLLKIDKKSFKGIDIYYIGYITKKKIGDIKKKFVI